MEFANARGRNSFALLACGGIPEKHAFLDVALHLPDVGRMRFVDIHDIERHAILVLPIQLVERGNLPAERRSGIAAKYKDNGFDTAKGRQCDGP